MTILKICAAIFVDVFRGSPQSVYDHVGTVAGNMQDHFYTSTLQFTARVYPHINSR